MIDYNTLSIGLLCSDSDSYNFCYEAVKDDFFDEIGGYMIESDGRIQKIRDKEKAAKAEVKKKAGNAKAKLAKLKKLDRKQKAAIAAAFVALAAVVVALKKTAPARAAKLTAKIEQLQLEYEKIGAMPCPERLTNAPTSRQDVKNAKDFLKNYKKQVMLGRRLTVLCKVWNIPFPASLFENNVADEVEEDFDE